MAIEKVKRVAIQEAKKRLMETYGLAEPEAYKFIQKTAMETRLRMIDVSISILEAEVLP